MSQLHIIMYHYVRDLENSRYPEIHGLREIDFIHQLDYLEKEFHIVSPQDVLAALGGV